MRQGVFGGTFDPIHRGHLDVALAALAALDLDEVTLVPSRIPPHRGAPAASPAHRFAMAALAIQGQMRLRLSDLELDNDGPSYTSVTLHRLAAQGWDLESVFFITGADAFRDIKTWRDYPAILDRCHFVAVSRPGCPAPSLRMWLPELADRMQDPGPLPAGRPGIFLVDAATAPVSSTDIRRRLASGLSIEEDVPEAVWSYIAQHGLYGPREKGQA